MSWEDLSGEVSAMFAELAPTSADMLSAYVELRWWTLHTRDRTRELEQRRVRYRTDPAFAEMHRAASRAWVAAHPEHVRIKSRASYQKARAAGLCGACRKVPSRPDRVCCEACRRQNTEDARRRRERERAAALGTGSIVCGSCGVRGHNSRSCRTAVHA